MQRCALFLFCLVFLSACSSVSAIPSPTSGESSPPALLYLRGDSTSGVLELILRQGLDDPGTPLPLELPVDCAIWSLFPAPVGQLVAIQLDCGGSPSVLLFNTVSAETSLLATDYETDARFLAWTPDGSQVYLKIDSLGNPRILRSAIAGSESEILSLPPAIYDLAFFPDGNSLLYSLTRGIGFGAETWLASPDGKPLHRLLSAPQQIIAYVRPSPQGDQIAYILMPDSQVPFTLGELWLADADGRNARFLAQVDSGHGYPPAWSPDGTQIAYVVRDNPDDPTANTSAAALESNLYIVDVSSGKSLPATAFSSTMVEAAVWSPDGNILVFDTVSNGTITLWISDRMTGSVQRLDDSDFSCCAIYRSQK